MAAQTRNHASPKEAGQALSAKHAIKTHESPSSKEHGIFPFLALPPEIRVMVMRYYFGSHTIHIIPEQLPAIFLRGSRGIDPDRLDHRVCIVEGDFWNSRQMHQVRDRQMTQVEDQLPPVSHDELHEECNLEDLRDYGPRTSELDINLLFVNKQVHQEATEILYGSHTFSFSSLDDLATFYHPMVKTQKPRLKKVQLVTEVYIRDRGDAPEGVSNLNRLHPRPEDVIPALQSITDLNLIVCIEGGDNVAACVGAGAVQTFHKAVRWHFGFLRQLTNLQNVIMDLQDPDELVDPEYIPIINQEFENELVAGPTGSRFTYGEEDEENWRRDIADYDHILSTNAAERTRLSRDLKRYQCHYSKAQRNV